MKFKIGDKVICLSTDNHVYNKKGKIIDLCNESYCSIEFDEYTGGHSGDKGKGRYGHFYSSCSSWKLVTKSEDELNQL